MKETQHDQLAVHLLSYRDATEDKYSIFKDFVFVVFAEVVNADMFADKWPWRVQEIEKLLLGETKDAIPNARRSGFRSLLM
jgi:hypothetical protein